MGCCARACTLGRSPHALHAAVGQAIRPPQSVRRRATGAHHFLDARQGSCHLILSCAAVDAVGRRHEHLQQTRTQAPSSLQARSMLARCLLPAGACRLLAACCSAGCCLRRGCRARPARGQLPPASCPHVGGLLQHHRAARRRPRPLTPSSTRMLLPCHVQGMVLDRASKMLCASRVTPTPILARSFSACCERRGGGGGGGMARGDK